MQDLDKFKNEMNLSGKNVYVGHRYVPKMFGEWDKSKLYEPLSIVQYQGNSFTSRQYVPVGMDINNEDYWVLTGNYNAQIEQYRQDVVNVKNSFNTLRTDTNNAISKIENNFPVFVTNVGVKNDGTDSTIEMQKAIDTYEYLYIPDGNYTFNSLILDSNTKIQASENAKITLKGQVKNKQFSVSSDQLITVSTAASRGAYELRLLNVSTLTVGDTIEIYDGNWLNPSDWLAHSKIEGNDWWKKQYAKVISINTVNSSIKLDRMIEFDILATSGNVKKVSFDENITITGGQWTLQHDLEAFNFKYVNNLQVEKAVFKSTTAESLLNISYSNGGSIKDNIVEFKKNAVIRLYYFTNGYTVENNQLYVEDVFSGDGTIQLYSYATNNRILNNLVLQRHTTENYSSFMMGIVIHTSQNNLVKDNVVQGFYYGLASYFGAKHNKFSGNVVSYNLVSGIYVHQSWYTDIVDNIIHSNGLYTGWANPQRAGITMQYTSNYINVLNNNFHDNQHDIVIMDHAKGWNIGDNNSNNTKGSFLNIVKGNHVTDTRTTVVEFNIYHNDFNGIDITKNISFIRNFSNNFNQNLVTNNKIKNVADGIYLYMSSQRNTIKGNMFVKNTNGLNLGNESILNIIQNNQFVDVVNGVTANGQAKLNDYVSNQFDNVTTQFTFTDDFNRSLDNKGLRARAPLGFVIHSINPNSGFDYTKRAAISTTTENDWVTVTIPTV